MQWCKLAPFHDHAQKSCKLETFLAFCFTFCANPTSLPYANNIKYSHFLSSLIQSTLVGSPTSIHYYHDNDNTQSNMYTLLEDKVLRADNAVQFKQNL